MQNFPLIALALVCVWLIVTPRIRTGILITTGLGMLCAGLLALMDDFSFNDRAIRFQLWGIGLIAAGFVWRYALRPLWLKLAMQGRRAHAGAKWFGFERRGERRSK
jgi:hypothetical protein